jgi:hypothetical protein
VPGAAHMLEELRTLERVADLAAEWLGAHVRGQGSSGETA